MIVQPPNPVYQTVLRNGRQDTHTPFVVKFSVSHPDAVKEVVRAGRGAVAWDKVIFGSVRRFDGVSLQVASVGLKETAMVALRTPQNLFSFSLVSCTRTRSCATISVNVYRKNLPVSHLFAGAPFVLVFHVLPTDGIITTTPFIVLSKQPCSKGTAVRGPPKRYRAPPPRRLVCTEKPVPAEVALDKLLVPRASSRLDVILTAVIDIASCIAPAVKQREDEILNVVDPWWP